MALFTFDYVDSSDDVSDTSSDCVGGADSESTVCSVDIIAEEVEIGSGDCTTCDLDIGEATFVEDHSVGDAGMKSDYAMVTVEYSRCWVVCEVTMEPVVLIHVILEDTFVTE